MLEYASVIFVMIFSGIGGGTIGFFLLPADPPKTPSDWLKSIGIGLGASVLVPLMLNTISSTLLSDYLAGHGKPGDLLIFLGFTLIAAVASRKFIETLTDRVLLMAKEAKESAARANEAANNADTVAKETQDALEKTVGPATDDIDGLNGKIRALIEAVAGLQASSQIPVERQVTVQVLSGVQPQQGAAQRIRSALEERRHTWRSIERLAVLGGVSEDDVRIILGSDPDLVLGKNRFGREIARLASKT